MSNHHDEPPEYLKTDHLWDSRKWRPGTSHRRCYTILIMTPKSRLFASCSPGSAKPTRSLRLKSKARMRVSSHRDTPAVDEWVDLLHDSVYQRATHSMAAVRMLAPLVESMFFVAFYKVREHFSPHSAGVWRSYF